jgi:hypothetical protein
VAELTRATRAQVVRMCGWSTQATPVLVAHWSTRSVVRLDARSSLSKRSGFVRLSVCPRLRRRCSRRIDVRKPYTVTGDVAAWRTERRDARG